MKTRKCALCGRVFETPAQAGKHAAQVMLGQVAK